MVIVGRLHPASAASAPIVSLDFWRLGKPTDDVYIGAFNGRVRAECMNVHWFLTLTDAREKLEALRGCSNEDRPHRVVKRAERLPVR